MPTSQSGMLAAWDPPTPEYSESGTQLECRRVSLPGCFHQLLTRFSAQTSHRQDGMQAQRSWAGAGAGLGVGVVPGAGQTWAPGPRLLFL